MAFFGRNQYLQNTDIPVYSAGDQPVQHPFTQQLGGLTKFGIGAAGLIAVGQFQFAPNYRGWDAIIQTVRAIEEYSPGQILRTFNLSAMLSPLERASQQLRYFSPDAIRRLKLNNYEWIADLNRLGIDIGSSQVMEQGFRFEGGQLLLGKTGQDVLLPYAGIVRNPVGGTPLWQEAGARSLAGGPLNVREAFTSPIQFETATGEASEEVFKFIGGRSRSQVAGRYLSATGTAFVERFNRLVKDPFSFLGENRVASKIGEMLGVEASSGLKTFGKLGLKLGIALPAAFLGYNELDYWVRQSGILPNGITGTAIKMWQGLNIGISQIAEWTGLQAWREKQEEIAPGSTTLKKLMAFPIVGALTMGGIGYGERIGRQAINQLAGLSLEQASLAGRYREAFIQQALYKTEVPSALKIGLGEKTIGLIEKSANQSLASVRGKIAFKVAEMQERKGILGLTKYLGKMSLTKASVLTGAAAGLLAVAPFIPGALIPSKRPEELRKIYSGEQLVPIRKGRSWLAGRSAFEGKRIQSYSPHWSVRYLSRARDIGTYGEDISPLQQFYRKNMTYDIEKLHYFDRPYPISSVGLEETPLIGPILSATIGRIIKPARLMHLDVMGRTPTGELGYPEQSLRVGETRPPEDLGGLPAGTPISPYGLKGTIGEQVYRFTEEIGLPGFAMTSLKEKITGSPDVFDQEMQLQSAVDIASMQRNYWEEELGDILGFSESFRRLVPHRRNQIAQWNEIPNTLAGVSWIPGAGDYSPNFQVGNPMSKIPLGEWRIPGETYFQLHPRLRNIPLEKWPTLDKLSVLGDIAPYSDKYKDMLIQARQMRKTPEEQERYKEIVRQVAEKKKTKEFYEYKYKTPARTEVQKLLADSNESEKTIKPGFLGSIFGKYWETIAHGIETPMEYLIPLSPGAKLVHMRTAVEDYERTQVFGKEAAFWQHPIEDFLKPFTRSLLASVGDRDIPEDIQRKRNIQQYFDVLKYIKFTKLRNEALEFNNQELAKEYEEQRKTTLTGVNVFSQNFSRMFKALPRSERDYFTAFAEADLEERQKILELIPESEKDLYSARWFIQDINDMRKAKDKGLLNTAQEAKLERSLETLYKLQAAEGYDITEDLISSYNNEKESGESYGDWYRRTKVIPAKTEGLPLPGPDWCVPGDTYILTDKGYKQIQEIKPETLVMTRKGLKKVKQVFCRNINEEIVELTTIGDTFHKLLITKEHPVFIDGFFKEAQKIHIGDFLQEVKFLDRDVETLDLFQYLPKNKYRTENDIIKNIKQDGPSFSFPRYLKITDDFYWLMGWFLAEGHIYFSENRMRGIGFTLSLKEKYIADKITNIIKTLFNKKCKFVERRRKTGNCLSVQITSQFIGYLFYSLCGKYSYEKNPIFPGSSRQLLIAAMEVLEGDGTWCTNRIRGNTASYQLALWMRDIFKANNVPTRFYKEQKKKGRHLFHLEIFCTKSRYQTKFREVKSVNFIPFVGNVYNLEIEDCNEYFTVLGLVHNCGYRAEVNLDLVKAKLLDNLGESPFEYDIWPEQQRQVARNPYLEEAVEELEDSKANREDMKKQLKALLASHGIRNARVDVIENSINKNRINMKMSQDRSQEIQWMKQKGKINV